MSGTRNYNLGTRDMADAALIALSNSANQKMIGETTVSDYAGRFSQFVEFAKENGVGRLEKISPALVLEYGRGLADKVDSEDLKASTAQNLVSSVNKVMEIVTNGAWESVGPVRDCGISQRTAIREATPPCLDRQVFNAAISELQNRDLQRQVSVSELARELGLRSKESSLLDARKAFSEATKTGVVTLTLGTKGGRERIVPISSQRQLDALSKAADLQGSNRSIMPVSKNWAQWREGDLRNGREIVQQISGSGYHDLRAAYACERYRELTGHTSPVENGGKMIANRVADHEARVQIAQELGHGRVDVVGEYIGGR
jgi:site-specific recombinase XerC